MKKYKTIELIHAEVLYNVIVCEDLDDAILKSCRFARLLYPECGLNIRIVDIIARLKITRAAKFIYRATIGGTGASSCLIIALSLHIYFSVLGYESSVIYGFSKDGGKIKEHSWLTYKTKNKKIELDPFEISSQFTVLETINHMELNTTKSLIW